MAYANTTANFNDDTNLVDVVVGIHLTSVSRILERGVATPLDGLMMGIGASGHKLFLACVDVPKAHPDTVITINFPPGATVGILAETLLGEGAEEAMKLVAMSRLNQMMGKDVVLRANRHLIESYLKSLLDKLAAPNRFARTDGLPERQVH